jgi:hypothetical protein
MPDARRGHLWVTLVIASLGSSCKREQSFGDAMRTLCAAPDRCCVGETDPTHKATTMARWITDHVTHPDVVAMFRSLAGVEGMDAKLALMREEVRRAGIDPEQCAMLRPWSTGPSL